MKEILLTELEMVFLVLLYFYGPSDTGRLECVDVNKKFLNKFTLYALILLVRYTDYSVADK